MTVDESVDVPAAKPRQTVAAYPWENTGRLARRYRHLRGQLVKLRDELETAVAAKDGQPLTVMQRKLIVDGVRHEAIARLCEARLAQEPDCSIADFASLLNRIAAATDASTRAIGKLGLDDKDSPLDRLYRKRPAAIMPPQNGEQPP